MKNLKQVLNGFAETVNKFKRKPDKFWVDQGKEVYNGSL